MTVEKPHFSQVALIGVGLLGGSLGLAMRRAGMADRIVGWGRCEERLGEAKSCGAIDEVTTDLKAAVKDADLVVCCTPVKHIIALLPDLLAACKSSALITDVGSTKEAICHAAAGIKTNGALFIGSHPMAGSERTGVAHASASLFEGATVFVTIDNDTPKDQAMRIAGLWQAVGGRVTLSHPRRHDRLVAAVSHLPHMVAVAAVESIGEVHDDGNFLARIVGGGFRDTTRVAQGSPTMWTDICTTNPREIVEAIDEFLIKLNTIRDQIVRRDDAALRETLERASAIRRHFE